MAVGTTIDDRAEIRRLVKIELNWPTQVNIHLFLTLISPRGEDDQFDHR
jgi:hypothetical protein